MSYSPSAKIIHVDNKCLQTYPCLHRIVTDGNETVSLDGRTIAKMFHDNGFANDDLRKIFESHFKEYLQNSESKKMIL